MTDILAIDPGLINGVAYGTYSDTEPFVLKDFFAVDFDGLDEIIWNGMHPWYDKLIIERFIPQSGAEYTLAEDDLAAVETIGMLKHGLVHDSSEVYWQTRSDKWDVPDRILKDNGFWKTGSDVGWTDGRDVNDAIIHILHYLKSINHLPTLRAYFRKVEA